MIDDTRKTGDTNLSLLTSPDRLAGKILLERGGCRVPLKPDPRRRESAPGAVFHGVVLGGKGCAKMPTSAVTEKAKRGERGRGHDREQLNATESSRADPGRAGPSRAESEQQGKKAGGGRVAVRPLCSFCRRRLSLSLSLSLFRPLLSFFCWPPRGFRRTGKK